MNNVVIHNAETAAMLFEERQTILIDMGESLAEVLKPLPESWRYVCTVQQDSAHDFVLDLTVYDEDKLPKVNLKVSFDFVRSSVYLDNMALIDIRGQGLGRALFKKFLHDADSAGFKRLTLQSSDIGSYFWITQGVQPDMHYLVSRMQSRLDEITRWVDDDVTMDARRLLAGMRDKPETIRELAALDFRTQIAEAFAKPAYQAEALRRVEEGFIYPEDSLAAEVGKVAAHVVPKQSPTLGQLLLVDTGWRGGMSIQPC